MPNRAFALVVAVVLLAFALPGCSGAPTGVHDKLAERDAYLLADQRDRVKRLESDFLPLHYASQEEQDLALLRELAKLALLEPREAERAKARDRAFTLIHSLGQRNVPIPPGQPLADIHLEQAATENDEGAMVRAREWFPGPPKNARLTTTTDIAWLTHAVRFVSRIPSAAARDVLRDHLDRQVAALRQKPVTFNLLPAVGVLHFQAAVLASGDRRARHLDLARTTLDAYLEREPRAKDVPVAVIGRYGVSLLDLLGDAVPDGISPTLRTATEAWLIVPKKPPSIPPRTAQPPGPEEERLLREMFRHALRVADARWRSSDNDAHQLIDQILPLAATVVARNPRSAEAWSAVALAAGKSRRLSDERGQGRLLTLLESAVAADTTRSLAWETWAYLAETKILPTKQPELLERLTRLACERNQDAGLWNAWDLARHSQGLHLAGHGQMLAAVTAILEKQQADNSCPSFTAFALGANLPRKEHTQTDQEYAARYTDLFSAAADAPHPPEAEALIYAHWLQKVLSHRHPLTPIKDDAELEPLARKAASSPLFRGFSTGDKRAESWNRDWDSVFSPLVTAAGADRAVVDYVRSVTVQNGRSWPAFVDNVFFAREKGDKGHATLLDTALADFPGPDAPMRLADQVHWARIHRTRAELLPPGRRGALLKMAVRLAEGVLAVDPEWGEAHSLAAHTKPLLAAESASGQARLLDEAYVHYVKRENKDGADAEVLGEWGRWLYRMARDLGHQGAGRHLRVRSDLLEAMSYKDEKARKRYWDSLKK